MSRFYSITDNNVYTPPPSRVSQIPQVEYQQLLAELDHLDFSDFYETLEVSVLGHYQHSISVLRIH